MRHLKTFESLGEESIILDLKDMALELNDSGFNIQISREYKNDDGIRIIITHKDKFTMNTDVKEFLFRAIGYMEDNGYKYDTHSNYGRLYFVEDGRIIISSGEARERYPRFTGMNITFKK